MKFTMALAVILVLSVPLRGQQDEYPHPIPNWHGPEPQSKVESIPLKACGIFEKKGKAYRYIAGQVPPDVWGGEKKQYSSDDMKKITNAGGMVMILPHHFSGAELEKQKTACDDWYHQQAKEYMKNH